MSRIKKLKPGKSLEKEEKKKTSKGMIMTIILGAIMIFSTFGIILYGYDSGTDRQQYKGLTFKRSGALWTTEINNKPVQFTYLPQDLVNINISSDAKSILSAKAAFLTFNPNSRRVQQMEVLRLQLGRQMYDILGTITVPAVTEENTLYKQPLVDCNNATQSMPVILIQDSNSTRITSKGSCVTLETDQYSINAVQDKLMYTLLGIE
jgi:hypothetical protein